MRSFKEFSQIVIRLYASIRHSEAVSETFPPIRHTLGCPRGGSFFVRPAEVRAKNMRFVNAFSAGLMTGSVCLSAFAMVVRQVAGGLRHRVERADEAAVTSLTAIISCIAPPIETASPSPLLRKDHTIDSTRIFFYSAWRGSPFVEVISKRRPTLHRPALRVVALPRSPPD